MLLNYVGSYNGLTFASLALSAIDMILGIMLLPYYRSKQRKGAVTRRKKCSSPVYLPIEAHFCRLFHCFHDFRDKHPMRLPLGTPWDWPGSRPAHPGRYPLWQRNADGARSCPPGWAAGQRRRRLLAEQFKCPVILFFKRAHRLLLHHGRIDCRYWPICPRACGISSQ